MLIIVLVLATLFLVLVLEGSVLVLLALAGPVLEKSLLEHFCSSSRPA